MVKTGKKTSKGQLIKKYSKKDANTTTAMKMPNTKTKKGSAMGEDAQRVMRHVNMIVDPCNAELGPTAYRGADGIISRFRNVSVVSPAGKTGFMFVFYPAYNAIQLIAVNPSDVLAFSPTAGGPGQSFLLASGASQRAVAACSSLNYTGTELDRSGVIYSGVVPIAALGVAKRVDEFAVNLQHESRVIDGHLEVKWSPSSIEEEYWESGVATPPGGGDRNAIVFIGLGFNPLTTSGNFSIINTLIAEWRPEPGLGLSNPNPSSHDVPGGIEKVRSTLQKLGNWWSNATNYVQKAYSSDIGKAIRTAVMLAI